MSIIAVVKELPGCSVRRGCGGGRVVRCSTANIDREKTTSTIIDESFFLLLLLLLQIVADHREKIEILIGVFGRWERSNVLQNVSLINSIYG